MAYVTNFGSDTVTPIATATNTAGTPIPVGGGPDGIAITPDGKTAYVANYRSNTVMPIATATNTVGSPIPVGRGPVHVAITPDQAPIARFADSPKPHGSPTSFDASASRGTTSPIVRYAWRFGDGATASAASPTTTHVYAAAGTYMVTLTVTDAAGTSTTEVFTGQTVSRNGGPSARTRRSVTIS